jgi:hypothetical protein
MSKQQQGISEEKRIIFEMIEASWRLAEQLGEHEVRPGCPCISCINRRKSVLKKPEEDWTFRL